VALGMPANERMDWLVEKATELGVVCQDLDIDRVLAHAQDACGVAATQPVEQADFVAGLQTQHLHMACSVIGQLQ
jgi:hypothetical protein